MRLANIATAFNLCFDDHLPATVYFLALVALNLLPHMNPKKGVGVHWGDAVLSFNVTDRALAAGGVHVELCDRGATGAPELVASGSIPGNFTLDLIGGSDSSGGKADEPAAPLEKVEREGGDGVTPSRVTTVEVRMFAKDGRKDAGVCVLNLLFKPDSGLHPAVGPEKNVRQDRLSGAQPLPKNTYRAVAATRALDFGDIRQASISLVEETAKHIRAIEEVRVRFVLRVCLRCFCGHLWVVL